MVWRKEILGLVIQIPIHKILGLSIEVICKFNSFSKTLKNIALVLSYLIILFFFTDISIKMHSYTATTMLSVCVILLALASHKTMAEDGVPTAPVRPEGGFSSSEDLKQYLTELRRYYAVVSRPR